MKQRKGFTLIELMIVIAIIIILAAIAIPNYLRMTDRAKRSRVAADCTSVATALEAYQVDWGTYPIETADIQFGKNNTANHIVFELSGTTGATTNISANTTLTGEPGGIDYIKVGTLTSMYNPFIPTGSTDADLDYHYWSSNSGNHWLLYVVKKTGTYLTRTDSVTDLTETTTAPAQPSD